MERYELEDAKRTAEYIVDEINKSLEVLRSSAVDIGLPSSIVDTALIEVKQKLFDYYRVFNEAYENKKREIDEEEGNKEEK